MQFVSPRQVARAIGVSESSLKRWCDRGLIRSTKTAGGHRRISTASVAEFLRQTSKRPVRPELLGLPAPVARTQQGMEAVADEFFQAVITGDESMCRRILTDLYLAGERFSRLGDALIAPTMRRVGEHWECGTVDVYQERRGCDVLRHALSELRGLNPAAKPHAPLAVGGTPACDPYGLPTALVELTLRQAGWQAQSLGSRLPFPTLSAAIRDLRPRLFWLSVSHVDDERQFVAEYADFYQSIPQDVVVVVGGRALRDAMRQQMKYAAYCDNLSHLETLLRAVKRTARS